MITRKQILEAEKILGTMLNNARHAGLNACRGAYYRDDDGQPCGPLAAVECCALGAWRLSNREFSIPHISTGNDHGVSPSAEGTVLLNQIVGNAFQHAMKK